jgi:hypothetical protein
MMDNSTIKNIVREVKKIYQMLHPKRSYEDILKRRVVRKEFFGRFIDTNTGDVESINYDAKKRYFNDLNKWEKYKDEFESSTVQDIIRRAADEIPGGRWFFDIHAKECKVYYGIVREHRPDVIVETGVHNGVKTLGILAGLRMNGTGKLHSIDSNEAHRHRRADDDEERTWKEIYQDKYIYSRCKPSSGMPGSGHIPEGREPGWIVPEEYRSKHWEYHSRDQGSTLPNVIDKAKCLDIFIHDSDTSVTTMGFEFELAWNRLSQGGLILSHHIGHNNCFTEFTDKYDCEYGLLCAQPDGISDSPLPSATGFIQK